MNWGPTANTILNKLPFLWALVLLVSCQPASQELEWRQEDLYSWAEVELGYFGSTGFEKLDPQHTNVSMEVSLTPEEIAENQMLLHGAGVATADVDGDGLVDIYFGQLNGPNKLYRNKGDFLFEDITEQAGVAHEGYYSTGVLFTDIDGDGDPDLLVNTMEGPLGVYKNDGTGQFIPVENSGLGEGNGGSTLTMADIDSDGDLDLFVANNKLKRVYDIFTPEQLKSSNVVEQPTGDETKYKLKEPFGQYYDILYRKNQPNRLGELGTKNKLFLNEGDGTFRDVTNEDGRFVDHNGQPYIHKAEWSLTALFQDINGDGRPDLYVCNDYFDPDRIWINRGDGRFKEIDPLAVRNYSYSSMGVDVADINRDGYQDMFVTEMLSQLHSRRTSQQTSEEQHLVKINEINYQPQYMRNSLYLNRGDYTFAEISYFSGVEASEWSWATRFLDVDLDGYEDIIINTGFAYDSIDMDYYMESNHSKRAIDLDETPILNLRNKIFRNNRDLTFTEKSEDWGFTEQDVSYGLATADLDNDGDLDVVNSRFNFEVVIFENTSNAPRIGVRLKGKDKQSQIIGAEVILEGGPVKQTKELASGGDYLSSSAPHFAFAADPDNSNHILKINWPNDAVTKIDSVQANRIYEVTQPEANNNTNAEISSPISNEQGPLFVDVSEKIDHHHHHEDWHDDRQVQPLLPIKLSGLGPGISWIDYDQDGDDDLFIPSGKGGSLGAFENLGNGEFSPLSLDGLTAQTISDQTTLLGWNTTWGTSLLLGNMNYETRDQKTPSVLNYGFRDGAVAKRDSIPGLFSTTGPIAATDYDGDGDIDLFVGGRFVPAQYPAGATSRLFINENGNFKLDQTNAQILKDFGLVTGAVFSDFDSDGDPDLLLSREWDSLLLLENENGTFGDVSSEYGLQYLRGWWKGVSTGDFNNDGRPDIVATNWGLNSPYQLNANFPLTMYYRDFNRDGSTDIIESYYSSELGAYVPRQQLEALQPLSSVLLRGVSSHSEYGRTSLRGLLQVKPESLPSRNINRLAHTLFINRGDRFEARSLPDETQFSAAFGATVFDYNNDGNEDLFLSQNFFGTPPDVPRLDAGRGQLLEGNGTGQFKAVPGQVSGIKVYGEQRGAAVSDFNSDGKVDLAVTQNDSTTKLYLNQTASGGISVNLVGAGENRSAIGSSVQLVYKEGATGPMREIQAGSGYWSQNGAVQVLGIGESREVQSIHIQWYDGETQEIQLKPDNRSYQIFKSTR
ncbi:FG-GAP-like repeat-containing protein [Aliifodinibius sp. S!AR15-10]|uniref:FG-GAP-like repeat-containing protein n=1 Tax=Aliifodinibius sp. S!AR15-10 TaxID=2950437 RepID=UPI002854F81B|nr:FG-GAP-like repeat-containing protein [Aliifodinibius sp. S!AR15-10]MDR8393807.1 FG-GAP-like repeat-containing protein [Aliifodinibius sp. S!AR15-10]